MRLYTTILPRTDGTVSVITKDGKEVLFTVDERTGHVTGEIEDKETITHLLSLGWFFEAKVKSKTVYEPAPVIEPVAEQPKAETKAADEPVSPATPVEPAKPATPATKGGKKGKKANG